MRRKDMAERTRRVIFLKDVVWELEHGPIPPGYKVSHRNRDRLHNFRENLVLLPESQYPGDDGQVFAVVTECRQRGAAGS
jgi:hypothetical protein